MNFQGIPVGENLQAKAVIVHHMDGRTVGGKV
jgi:hypothetical protein